MIRRHKFVTQSHKYPTTASARRRVIIDIDSPRFPSIRVISFHGIRDPVLHFLLSRERSKDGLPRSSRIFMKIGGVQRDQTTEERLVSHGRLLPIAAVLRLRDRISSSRSLSWLLAFIALPSGRKEQPCRRLNDRIPCLPPATFSRDRWWLSTN